MLVPDLAGWRRTRLPELPDVAAMTLAPDWVCEVLSPSTQGLDRVRKRRIDARENVPYVWLVDPAARLLEVFRLRDGQYVLVATQEADDRARMEPFDAMELDVGKLWAR